MISHRESPLWPQPHHLRLHLPLLALQPPPSFQRPLYWWSLPLNLLHLFFTDPPQASTFTFWSEQCQHTSPPSQFTQKNKSCWHYTPLWWTRTLTGRWPNQHQTEQSWYQGGPWFPCCKLCRLRDSLQYFPQTHACNGNWMACYWSQGWRTTHISSPFIHW